MNSAKQVVIGDMVSGARDGRVSGEERDGFRFRGGHPALDFTATLTGRVKSVQRDLLATGDDLRRWLSAAGYACSSSPSDDALSLARDVREAIFDLAVSQIEQCPPPADALKRINDLALGTAAAPQLDKHRQTEITGSAEALVVHLAREAIILLGGPDAGRIRLCEGDGCAILFIDRSRSGERRWCSMKSCGNRHKVSEHRRRNKDGKAQ